MRRLGIRLAALGAVAALTLTGCNFGSQGPVGSGGTTNGVFLTSRTFNVRLVNMPATYRDGAVWALSTQYAPTTLAVTWTTATSCPGGVRLCVFARSYGANGLNGWNACHAGAGGQAHPNKTCGQQFVRINTYYNPPRRRIACHEIGHSTGLRHTGEQASCMKRSADGGTSQVLSGHDREHLNNHY